MRIRRRQGQLQGRSDVPPWVYAQPLLTVRDADVLAYMHSFSRRLPRLHGLTVGFWSQENMAEYLGIKKRWLKRHVQKLKQLGYIITRRLRYTNPKRFTRSCNLYFLLTTGTSRAKFFDNVTTMKDGSINRYLREHASSHLKVEFLTQTPQSMATRVNWVAPPPSPVSLTVIPSVSKMTP